MMASEQPRPDHWRTRAACRGEDINLFFPGQGAVVGPAKKICDTCPVRRQCIEDDLAAVEALQVRTFGVRGGLTARARRDLINARRGATTTTEGTTETMERYA